MGFSGFSVSAKRQFVHREIVEKFPIVGILLQCTKCKFSIQPMKVEPIRLVTKRFEFGLRRHFVDYFSPSTSCMS